MTLWDDDELEDYFELFDIVMNILKYVDTPDPSVFDSLKLSIKTCSVNKIMSAIEGET